MSKTKRKQKINPITGWILIARDRDDAGTGRARGGPLYVCWEGTFHKKRIALAFAEKNGWPKPYWAVRGRIAAD